MKARTRNAMRAMVAAAVMTMSATTMANAVQSGRALPKDERVATRMVAQYVESAWLKPQAVVLESEAAWDKWNADMVAKGWSMGAELAPEGVDWTTEALLVVALGELSNAYNLSVTGASKADGATEVQLYVGNDWGGSSPSVVVALPRSAAQNVKLVSNMPLPEMPMAAERVSASSTDTTTPATLAVSWGTLKADYR